MIVETEQFILLTGIYSNSTSKIKVVTWTTQNVFADQTELVKWMMTTSYSFDMYKIVKCKLPLLEQPDTGTIDLDEVTLTGQVVELEDKEDEYATTDAPEKAR